MSSTVQKLVGLWHRYENLNLKIAFVLISLQLIHLYWLTADVVIQRITGESMLGVPLGSPLFIFFIIIDYVEIPALVAGIRSEEHTSELQSHSDLVCRLLLEKKKTYHEIGRRTTLLTSEELKLNQ